MKIYKLHIKCSLCDKEVFAKSSNSNVVCVVCLPCKKIMNLDKISFFNLITDFGYGNRVRAHVSSKLRKHQHGLIIWKENFIKNLSINGLKT